MRDYRTDQFRRDWWNERVYWLGGITYRDLSWVVVGIVIAVLFFKYPINWDHVFGLRP